ncbi:Gfo/Idh/MocA family protein [Litorivivens sp.]|uniref:Gfo/Idh/MocA family protein n=1 Tax=Litorivivens sp. TaxID=2020868 RepID=UPI0035653854
MDTQIRVLIVGLGQIGMQYDQHLPLQQHVYSHCRAFSSHPAFCLVGAVDASPQQRAVFESRYSSPAFERVEQALDALEADLVIIATPTANHFACLRTVLQLVKPMAILCEKPLSYHLDEAREMVELCHQRSTKLFVNYMRRSDPGVIAIKDRLLDGRIECPVKGFVWYSKGLIHNGSHFFNLLQYWLGDFVDHTPIHRLRELEHGDCDLDFKADFQRGEVVFLALDPTRYAHYAVELMAPNGRLRYEGAGHSLSWSPAEDNPEFQGSRLIAEQPLEIFSGMKRFQFNVAAQINAALKEDIFYLSQGEDALATMECLSLIIGQK